MLLLLRVSLEEVVGLMGKTGSAYAGLFDTSESVLI